jgi:hypothetical protein
MVMYLKSDKSQELSQKKKKKKKKKRNPYSSSRKYILVSPHLLCSFF